MSMEKQPRWRLIVGILLAFLSPFIIVSIIILGIKIKASPIYSDVSFYNVLYHIVWIIRDTEVPRAFWATIYLAVRGLVMGLSIAIVIIIIAGKWPKWSWLWISIVNSLRAIPLTLFIPFLFIIPVYSTLIEPPWISLGYLPARDPAYIIALGTLLYLLIGASEGIDQRDNTRECIYKKHLKLSSFQYFRNVLIFEMTPSLLSIFRLTFLFALVLAIVLEQLIPYDGVGRMIQTKASSGVNEVSESLALLYYVGLIGTLADLFFIYIRKYFIPWEKSGKEL